MKIITDWCIFRIYPDLVINIWLKTKKGYNQYLFQIDYRIYRNKYTEDTLPTFINIGL